MITQHFMRLHYDPEIGGFEGLGILEYLNYLRLDEPFFTHVRLTFPAEHSTQTAAEIQASIFG